MNHEFLRILADGAIFFIVLLLPVLWVIFTDRFRRLPSPSQYLALFALALLAGIFLFLPSLSIVFATAIMAIGIAWVSGHFALTGVTYEREFFPSRLFPGDEGQLTIRLKNQKMLPLAWITATDPILFSVVRGEGDLQRLLAFSGGIEVLENLGQALVNRTAIGPFQELRRTYTISALARGVYTLGPADVVSGDPFGVFQEEAQMGGHAEIVVYPHVYTPQEIGLPFREPLGSVVTRRTLFDDPTLIAGSREYRAGDPLHHMHWKATARTANLQVRVTDASTTAQLMIVLNLNMFQHVWEGVDFDRMEATIDAAASLAIWALDRDFAVGLRANGMIPGSDHMPRLAPSASPQQPSIMLEHLARLAYSGRNSAERILLDEERRLSVGGSIVFVTSILTQETIAVLTSRRLTGRVSVVYCGRQAAPVIRGVPIYLMTPPAEVAHAAS
jgi:uncharacterized protein (DUF58 family)